MQHSNLIEFRGESYRLHEAPATNASVGESSACRPRELRNAALATTDVQFSRSQFAGETLYHVVRTVVAVISTISW
jgi:hypothetical protein